MLMSPRRGALIGWRGPAAFPGRGPWPGGGAPPAPRPPPPASLLPPPASRARARPRPALGAALLPRGRRGACGAGGRLRRGLPLLPAAGVLALTRRGVRDDDPTPRPAVQAEDGISAEGFQAAPGPPEPAVLGRDVGGRRACPRGPPPAPVIAGNLRVKVPAALPRPWLAPPATCRRSPGSALAPTPRDRSRSDPVVKDQDWKTWCGAVKLVSLQQSKHKVCSPQRA